MSDQIITEAAKATGSLMETSIVVSVLLLVIIGGYFVGKALVSEAKKMFAAALDQCEKREARAIENWERANERGAEALEKFSTECRALAVSIVELKGEIRK